eukprot:5924460-Pleurochrysis_carterae.AAC.1
MIGGGHDVQPFGNYRTGSWFTDSRSILRRRAPVRAFLSKLPVTCVKLLLPRSPRALFACFAIYVPWPRRNDRRRTHDDSVPSPIQPASECATSPHPALPPTWPDASPVDLR